MNQDFVDLLRALSDAEARFLVVGAFAVGRYARPRATGDLDLWIEPTPTNAARVFEALHAFGAPLEQLSVQDLHTADTVFQMGVAPARVDLLTTLTGVDFASAWERRETGRLGGVALSFISRDDLVRNKRAVGRPRDLADIADLESA